MEKESWLLVWYCKFVLWLIKVTGVQAWRDLLEKDCLEIVHQAGDD